MVILHPLDYVANLHTKAGDSSQLVTKYLPHWKLLNQARAGHTPGFLKLILCGLLECMCVYVCVPAPKATNN